MRGRNWKLAGILILLAGAASLGMVFQSGTQAKTLPSTEASQVAVTINGHKIMESDIDEALAQGIPAGTVDEARLAQLKEAYRDKVLDAIMDEWLLDQKARDLGVSISQEDMRRIINQEIAGYLKTSGLTQEEFEARLKERTGKSFEEFVDVQASSPGLRQAFLHEKIVAATAPETMKVTEEEIRSYYDNNRDTEFSRPAMVRASHILAAVKPGASQEDKDAALARIKDVTAQLEKPGADFGELARKNSDCPSSEKGGDLGFFPESAMTKPFAEAAFALKKGETSGPVETSFGYHVIRVTDTRPAENLSLEAAREQISGKLQARKVQAELLRLVTQLRQEADIVYPSKTLPAAPA